MPIGSPGSSRRRCRQTLNMMRAFAVFSLALADAFISSLEGKFTYHFWRPWTAIQNAAAIGLPELQDPRGCR